MSDFEIICLANSRKRQGRCVAGIRTDGQGWIRPVGWNADGSLYVNNYWLDNKTEAQVLDVIRLRCIRACPKPHHPEDWTNAGSQWKIISRPASAEHLELLKAHLVEGPALFGNTQDSVPAAQFKTRPAGASLALIAPETLQWIVRDSKGKRKIAAQFTLCGAPYQLMLTDPVYEQRLAHLPYGTYPRTAAGIPNNATVWLTISLGEPFQKATGEPEHCYKIAAGVIVLPPMRSILPADVAVSKIAPLESSALEPEPIDWSLLMPVTKPAAVPVPPAPVPDPAEKSKSIKPESKLQSKRMAELRAVHTRNYERWTEEEETSLIYMIRTGQTLEEIVNALQRAESAVLTRIGKLVLDRYRSLL